MSKQSASGRVVRKEHAGLALAFATAVFLTGCASGDFSKSTTPPVAPVLPNPNPPSLPALTAAATSNTYVGTQAPGSSAPENVVSLALDDAATTYDYQDIALSDTPANPLSNSSGRFVTFGDYSVLGDTTGALGTPGTQYFGIAAEVPGRLTVWAPNTSTQISAMVPAQASGCVTPTAAATYQFVTLYSPDFLPNTDTAWGTVSISANTSSFTFTTPQQFTQSGKKASSSLIPFAASTCTTASDAPSLGSYIDTPPAKAKGGVVMRSFLGPTGFLVANLQGNTSSGDPLALPGLVGMIQPAAAVDLAQVTGTASSQTTYRTFVYQPSGSPVVQYGYFGQSSSFLTSVDNSVFTNTKTVGILGAFQSPSSLATVNASSGIVFGAQDANNPGLFPHALFIYPLGAPCPSDTKLFYTPPSVSLNAYCSSPATAMVGLHDGKYVILVTGAYEPTGNTPTVMILIEQ